MPSGPLSAPTEAHAPPTSSNRVVVLFWILLVVTAYAIMNVTVVGWYESESKRLQVWWYGWITAASTGLGVVPFLFVRDMSGTWLGVCNGT